MRDQVKNEVKVQILPAGAGDCIIIEFENGKTILIDCGYKDTFDNYLKPILINLRKLGRKIDLFIITHMHSDHIRGAIEFIKQNGNSKIPKIIPIEKVWFNSFRDINFSVEKVDKVTHHLRNLYTQQTESNILALPTVGKDEISADETDTLFTLLEKNHYCIDSPILQGKIEYVDDIKIEVVSPTQEDLDKLGREWEKILNEIVPDWEISNENECISAFESSIEVLEPNDNIETEEIASTTSSDILEWPKEYKGKTDPSNVNRSSIAVYIAYKKNKMLFLGDANESVIIDYWDNNKMPEHVNLIKLSHHGSEKNNFKLLDNVCAKNYLISTDGVTQGHPSRAVIGKSITNTADHKVMCFNYKNSVYDLINKDELKKKYSYELVCDGVIFLGANANG